MNEANDRMDKLMIFLTGKKSPNEQGAEALPTNCVDIQREKWLLNLTQRLTCNRNKVDVASGSGGINAQMAFDHVAFRLIQFGN